MLGNIHKREDGKMNHDKKIVLQDGREFYGTGFGAEKDAVCELVFIL